MLSTFAAFRRPFGGDLLPYEQVADAGSGGGGTDPAGAGGGSTPPPDASASSDPSPGDAVGAHADREEALEDLIAEDDDVEDARPIEERFKAVVARSRKLKRQLAKRAGQLKRLEGVDLDELFTAKRNYQQVQEALARLTPDQRAVLYGGSAPKPAAAPAPPPKDPEFDESSLPFDPNENEVNRYFATLAKQNHELSQALRKMESRFGQAEAQQTAQREAQIKTQWKGAIDAAAERITSPRERRLFKDAMAGAYNARHTHRRTPAQLIEDYFRESADVPLAEGQQATAAAKTASDKALPAGRPTAALKEKLAKTNDTLPRTVAPTGVPAPAKSEKPSLADIRKRLGGGRRI